MEKKDITIESLFSKEQTEFDSYFDKSKQKKVEKDTPDSLSVFVSFDICDSTQMKTMLPNWKQIILSLYQTDPISYLRKWKYIGDEVVFFGAYNGFSELIELISLVYSSIKSFEGGFKKITQSLTGSNQSIKVKIKATVWLAKLSTSQDDFFSTFQLKDINEFIGPHMDEGFRMATKSSESKLLIDPKIVYLVLFFYCFREHYYSGKHSKTVEFNNGFIDNYIANRKDIDNKEEEINQLSSRVNELYQSPKISASNALDNLCKTLSNIHFLYFSPLKGIWNNKPYPIFWYFDDACSYKYYELDRVDLFPISLYEIMTNITKSRMYYSSRDLLKVFETANVDESIIDIVQIALQANNLTNADLLSTPVANFYYTIACVKEEKVLVLRRKENRRHLGNVWEFFVSKHTNLTTNTEVINSIKNTLNLDITLLTDRTKEDNILPLHFCTVYRSQKKHNSILCCAEVNSQKTIDELEKEINNYINSSSNTKYAEARFVGIDELEEFTPLNIDVINYDSYVSDSDKSFPFQRSDNYATMYFSDSIQAILSFYKKYKEMEQSFEWKKLFE